MWEPLGVSSAGLQLCCLCLLQVGALKAMQPSARPGLPLPKYCSVATAMKAPDLHGAVPPWNMAFTCPFAMQAPWLPTHCTFTRYQSLSLVLLFSFFPGPSNGTWMSSNAWDFTEQHL